MEKDGLAGLHAVLEWKPHVVILDRRLPKLNGDDLARCIVEQAEKVPALFLITGEPTHSLAPVPGVVRLFTKPISFAALYAVMKPYLDDVGGGEVEDAEEGGDTEGG